VKSDLVTKALLAVVAALLMFNLLKGSGMPAQAEPPEGPVGAYQISAYTMPPTDTRPNYLRGYLLLDTRTGKVEVKEEKVW